MNEIKIPRLAIFVTGLNLKNEAKHVWYGNYGQYEVVRPDRTVIDVKIGKSTMLTGDLAAGDELKFVDLDQIESTARMEGYDEGWIAGYEKAKEEVMEALKEAEEIFFGKDRK